MMQPLTENFRADGMALSLSEYLAREGYEGYKRALKMSSAEVINLIKDAVLLGRGGAGFATAIKMGAVPKLKDPNEMRYLVVNADEMEPGTFKDRILLEQNPHQ